MTITTKVYSLRSTKKSLFHSTFINKDLLLAHFAITDITSELKNCIFAEIVPHIFYQLYNNLILFVNVLLEYLNLYDIK